MLYRVERHSVEEATIEAASVSEAYDKALAASETGDIEWSDTVQPVYEVEPA